MAVCAFSAQAQFFTNGNLAVVRIGGDGQFVSSNGIAVHIDQFTTNGALLNTVDLPTSGSNSFVLDNSATEGNLTLSENDQYLVLGGYNTTVGGGFGTKFGLNGTASTAVSRSIATVDGYGNYVLQITNNLAFTTWPIESAVFDGTNNFWMEGESSTNQYSGIVYVGTPENPTSVVVANSGNEEAMMNVYNGSLFIGSSFSPNGIYQVLNTNTPTAPLPENTNAVVAVIPLPTASRNKDFTFDPGMTTCYYADTSIGIVKFTNNAGTWVSNYTVSMATTGFTTKGAGDLAVDWTQSPAVIYATTAETTGNRLISLVDSGPTAVPTVLAQALTNHVDTTNVFRGVRFTPSNLAPMITAQPASVVETANGTARFTVAALGSPTLSYQWYTNGVPVAGATASSLAYDNVTTFESGTVFKVVVTNGYGAVTSTNATLTVNANFFIGHNLAVVSVGGPGEFVSSSDTGNSVHILQFTPGGTPISTLDLPTSGPESFALDGSATEGFMTMTENGQYLVLGGYNAAPGTVTGGLAASTSTNVPRAVVTIDGNGNYAMPIANPNIYSTFNIRGAVFDGTNNFWVSGGGAPSDPKGVFYVGTPGSIGASAVQVDVGETGTGNERVLNIFNDTLYISTGSVSHGIFALTGPNSPPPPIGLPTNPPIQVIAQPGSASGPYDFAFDSGNTTCYVADGNLGGIIKYTNNAGSWVSNYMIPAGGPGTNVGGLAVDFTQTPAVLYATTLLSGAAGNQLISIIDSGVGSTATVLATATANAGGSNYFRGVRFVPGEGPSITNEPAPVVQAAGGDATFTVGVSGTPPFQYQWYTNGTEVDGGTNSSVTLTDLNLNQTGTMVAVAVKNGYGTTASGSVLLTVQTPNSPFNVGINPPTSLTVNAGGTASFTASAVGANLTYYWQLNGAPLTDGASVSGSSSPTLIISPAFATYNGTYTVTASNSFGAQPATNSATLTVIDPIITAQPMGSTNLPGVTTTLSVTAIGAPTLGYQWLLNGLALSGANATTLSVPNAGTISSAQYSVIVSNGLGNSVTSAVTTVAFTPVLLKDTFSYPNGNLFGDAGSPWTDINGSNPEIVTNGRVQVSESNATTDAQSLFSMPVNGTVVWSSFTINLSVLPSNPGGVYFANFEDTNFGFFGRIFTLTSNSPSLTPNMSPTAFPGTYRLGIANGQNDSTPSASSGPNVVVPLDLAPGIDYTVVFYLDLNSQVSGMAINPATLSDVTAASVGGVSSGAATDGISPTNAMAAFGLRQRTDSTPKGEGEGVMEMDNLVVSFDWNGAGSGYSVVTQDVTATNPIIGLQPVGTTNFSGTSYTMEVAASGIGTAGSGLTYAWYFGGTPLTDGGSITGSATPTLSFNPLQATNSGTYYVVVTGAVGGPIQSSNAVILVNTVATPPVFTVQPDADTTNSQGGTVILHSLATGTGPITYEWYFSNAVDVAAVSLGITNADLTLSSLTTNETGTYFVIATGDNGVFQTQSSNAFLTVTGPKSVTIGYLRSLLNPVTYQPSDASTFYTVTGVITTATNQTTGNTASYYLQDSTGGINLFVTFGADFRPALGDEVTATGTLSSYVDNYELDVSEGTTGYTNFVVGTNFPMPTPILFPWGNDVAPLSPELSTNVEGSVVVITNLYFAAYTPGALFTNQNYIITNNSGEQYTVFISDQDTNFVVGQPIPPFATSIAGPLIQDDGTIGISFTVWSNLVAPASLPPLTNILNLSAGLSTVTNTSGTNSITLNWTAVPSNYTYSVWYSADITKPFSNLVSGLVFSNTLGTYTDSNATNAMKFYEIVSP
ncbi:MAG TPA: hypothetical protein VGO67_10995 [Verrucomicrobiae bacterium]